MDNYTSETLPEFFQFVMGQGDDETVFYATYPRNDFNFSSNNRIFVGWVKNGKASATSYLISHVVELVNCGSWKIINV